MNSQAVIFAVVVALGVTHVDSFTSKPLESKKPLTEKIHGGWSCWSECSVSCGAGTSSRTCTNPEPKFGGDECVGEATEECIEAVCPTPITATEPNNCADLIEPIFGTDAALLGTTAADVASRVKIQCDGETSTCTDECKGNECTNIYNFHVCCNCGGGDHITTSTCGATCDFKKDLQPIEILDGSHEDECAVVRALIEGENGCLSTCTHDELNEIVKNAKATHAAVEDRSLDATEDEARWYTDESYNCSIAGFTGALNTADLAPAEVLSPPCRELKSESESEDQVSSPK